jgi:alcohol dehydrogenase
MFISPFSVARLPRIIFGPRVVDRLPQLILQFGRRALFVTGEKHLRGAPQWQFIIDAVKGRGISREDMIVRGEPSPQLIDQAVKVYRHSGIQVVVGIGGGSVLDAAKAIAGLLVPGNSIMDHLEGVGPEKPYQGPATPFIAVPTTAGTGSEATKNAVLSFPGAFKKSFRDDQLVAEYALVDPDLLKSCPPSLIAANGMDALTQLLESYVSTKASPFTDALALSGLAAVRDGLLPWHDNSLVADVGRANMAYAALLSGITLAQAGLGSVHGLAAPLGAFFPIPHGVACGTLLHEATAMNLKALKARLPSNPVLKKYADIGRLFHPEKILDDEAAHGALLDLLEHYTRHMDLPRLSEYGVEADHLDQVVAGCRGNSMKTNPVLLEDSEVRTLLQARL